MYLSLAMYDLIQFSSVQFSHSVVSDSLRPYDLQHARPPCLSPTPRVHPNSCPSSWWCYPAISSSVVPFSSCPQFLPASESFPTSQLCMRWPKYWSFSFSISPSKEHPGLVSFRMILILEIYVVLNFSLVDKIQKGGLSQAGLSWIKLRWQYLIW